MSQKIAVVTGGNRGIGLEICRRLAQEGLTVILTARDQAKGKTAQAQLQAAGFTTHFYPLDVANPVNIQQLRQYLETEFGRLDILVNNAGVFLDRGQTGLTVDPDMIRQTLETNVYGPLQLCQALIPLMQRQNYGRIVNVSSRMGQLSEIGGGALAYRTSKTALNAVTAILAAEVRDANILINAVSPGWVRTDMGGSAAARSVEEGADTAVWLALLPDGGPSGGFFHDRVQILW